jgi:hypothetical protein
MIKIAHRGNQHGPSESENNPVQIVATISGGYDVEVDIWYVDDELYLGHDGPDHKIDHDYLKAIADEAWFHCKNLEALNFFKNNHPDFKYFWHQEDHYTLTSNGYIWTYPGQPVTENSILVNLGVPNLEDYEVVPYAICSDYVGDF